MGEDYGEPWTNDEGEGWIRSLTWLPAGCRVGELRNGYIARRAIACVNACKGIPTEALDLGIIEEMMAERERYQEQGE